MTNKMTFKKLFGKLHLWLGLATGLVVLIQGLTGAIYCFAPELQNRQWYRKVQVEHAPLLPPSQIKQIAEQRLPGKMVQRIYYDARDKAVMVLFSEKGSYNYSVFINPYNGDVLKVRDNHRDFFSVVLQLHRTLLIPYGQDIIRWATVVFLLMLVSGIILWWPRNRKTAKRGFKIMWNAHPKRLNYDLHRILGFYATWIVLFTAITGLLFGFENLADRIYQFTGSRHSVVQKKPPVSDTSGSITKRNNGLDLVWGTIQPDLHKKYATALLVLPAGRNGAILLRANPESGTLYKTDFRYFDQFTGKEIPGAYVWGNYRDAHTPADYLKRMNYDIHTGAVWGLPGRIALFFASLIVASLPVTGFLFWWGRKHKRRKTTLAGGRHL
ncbi:MAG: PepSY domain-containing protein [Bacteroidetes bacterium]|nr:PepSY domain-containing protein [Bacteroidota bacterium]